VPSQVYYALLIHSVTFHCITYVSGVSDDTSYDLGCKFFPFPRDLEWNKFLDSLCIIYPLVHYTGALLKAEPAHSCIAVWWRIWPPALQLSILRFLT